MHKPIARIELKFSGAQVTFAKKTKFTETIPRLTQKKKLFTPEVLNRTRKNSDKKKPHKETEIHTAPSVYYFLGNFGHEVSNMS